MIAVTMKLVSILSIAPSSQMHSGEIGKEWQSHLRNHPVSDLSGRVC